MLRVIVVDGFNRMARMSDKRAFAWQGSVSSIVTVNPLSCRSREWRNVLEVLADRMFLRLKKHLASGVIGGWLSPDKLRRAVVREVANADGLGCVLSAVKSSPDKGRVIVSPPYAGLSSLGEAVGWASVLAEGSRLAAAKDVELVFDGLNHAVPDAATLADMYHRTMSVTLGPDGEEKTTHASAVPLLRTMLSQAILRLVLRER